ncbi:Proline/betaine transporter [compost metagenome]
MLAAICATSLNAVAFYLILSYMPTYLSSEMGMSETDSFLASTVSLATYIGFIFMMGMLSDRFGRKTMLILASLLFIGLTFPLFGLLDGQGFMVILLIQIAFGLMLAMNDGTLPCYLAEIFPTRVRYSGFAFSFNTAQALFGGTAPFVATWLISQTGDKMAPSWLLIGAAVVALFAVILVKGVDRRLAD